MDTGRPRRAHGDLAPRRRALRDWDAQLLALRGRGFGRATRRTARSTVGRDVFGLLRRVRVDVLVTRELADLVHHLVGELAQREVFLLEVAVARRGRAPRRSAPSPGRNRRGIRLSTGCTSSVPISPTGTIGVPVRSERRATPVCPRCRYPSRVRPFGIDAEHPAALQHLGRRRERPFARAPALAPDGDLTDAAEEPRRLGVVEVLGLGHERDAPPDDQREEDRVEERPVVRREDHRTRARRFSRPSTLTRKHTPKTGVSTAFTTQYSKPPTSVRSCTPWAVEEPSSGAALRRRFEG